MPDPRPTPQRFLVTTPGLSATRWFSFVLASHPGVFVAHGKHPLDSILHGQFAREKTIDDLESITQGNLAAEFYARESLDAIFAAYRELRPQARAIGNVHTFTLEALMRKVRGPEELNGIKILNVLRHPVRYVASHTALVRSAERFPLYQHYLRTMFPQVVTEVPAVLQVACEDFPAFVAFAVSCLSVRNLARDFVYPQFRSVQMELLTTQVDALKTACEELTGLDYPVDPLMDYLRHGAINRHRKGSAGEQAWQVYRSWAPWQRELARLVIPPRVIQELASFGYDVSMLHSPPDSDASGPSRVAGQGVPSLADHLRATDPEHPWLTSPKPTGAALAPPPPQLVEVCQGYNIVAYQGRYHALARALGPIDLTQATPERLRSHQANGHYGNAATLPAIHSWIAQRSASDFDGVDRRLAEAVAVSARS